MKNKLEVCCGSYADVVMAQRGGADRVELNSALYMGGLTPSLASLTMAKKQCTIPVIAMVRPRGAGFYYDELEQQVMMEDAKLLLEHGADGLAFGFLKESAVVDMEATAKMVKLIHSYGKEAVFHRAIDCVTDMDEALQQLIAIGVDRVLTSGGAIQVEEGIDMLATLQKRYGEQIEILAGSGVHAQNAENLLKKTDVHQLHSSCKAWKQDPTTIGKAVSYAYAQAPNASCYDVVDEQRVCALVKAMKETKGN